MKITHALILASGWVAFGVGLFFWGGDRQAAVGSRPSIELHFEVKRDIQFLNAYTFYRDADGREVFHGPFIEYHMDTGAKTELLYRDGAPVSGTIRQVTH